MKPNQQHHTRYQNIEVRYRSSQLTSQIFRHKKTTRRWLFCIWWRRRDSDSWIFIQAWTIPSSDESDGERLWVSVLPSTHPSIPWRQVSLGTYESLAGLLVSHSPDGVGIGPLSRSVHRMSSLFPIGITPYGDHFTNRTRVRRSSAFGSTCLFHLLI